MGNFGNVSANSIGNSTHMLIEGINGETRNLSHNDDEDSALLRSIADLEISKEIDDSLVASNNRSSENGSFDEFFASLGNAKISGF